MTEEEKELMERYGITVKKKSVYSYKGYEYDRLDAALNYAKIDTGPPHESATSKAGRGVLSQ